MELLLLPGRYDRKCLDKKKKSPSGYIYIYNTYTCVCGAIKLEREKWKCQGLFLLFFFVYVWVCCRLSARIIHTYTPEWQGPAHSWPMGLSAIQLATGANMLISFWELQNDDSYAVIFRRALLDYKNMFFFGQPFFFNFYEIVTFESGGHWNPPGLKRKETKNKQNNLYENWVRREWTRS